MRRTSQPSPRSLECKKKQSSEQLRTKESLIRNKAIEIVGRSDSWPLAHLLYQGEGTTLDFKSEQYRFSGATDDEKSELLKDILAFANAWRNADAYILIGVKEVKGGRGEVMGISEHLEDAHIQQLVNSKTQRAIEFSYKAAEVEGVQVGIIIFQSKVDGLFISRKTSVVLNNRMYTSVEVPQLI